MFSIFEYSVHNPLGEMISAGLPLALATDFNRSTPGNMNFVVATLYKMKTTEGSYKRSNNKRCCHELEATHGSVIRGKSCKFNTQNLFRPIIIAHNAVIL
jgi:imidazolonepropionase